MDKIYSNIYIGSSADARNTEALKAAKITAVLNVARDLPVHVPTHVQQIEAGIEQYRVGLVDGPGNPPDLLRAAVYALRGLIAQGRFVLVHCHEGRSRSAVVVAAAIAGVQRSSEAENIDRVLAEIRQRRPLVNPEPPMIELAKNTYF